jgi:hypothetical protein
VPQFVIHKVKMNNGEVVEIRGTTDGDVVCPVCGFLADLDLPWDPDSGFASFDICPCCKTQYGWDDAVSKDAPTGAVAERWKKLRDMWLTQVGSDEEALAQLKNLGISIPPDS